MQTKTNELALEQAIEKALTGTILEDVRQGFVAEDQETYGSNGFRIGFTEDFNAKYAVDEVRLWHFLEETQPKELAKINGTSDWKLRVLQMLDRTIKKFGLLRVLKKGLEIDNAHFTFFYQAPLASSSEAVKANFEQNEFSATRQVQYNLDNRREEIDMVLFINGLPISTMELKNAWTHQTARDHGIRQYKQDRDFTQPLLQFGRCLVHFAVDTEEVYMTTRLQGQSTFFLPFNKGNNNGKGNPVNPFGHRTEYLWNEVLKKESIANLMQHFIRFDGKSKDALTTRTLFFPRYHQMEVVRNLLKDVSTKGVGQTYLIQHSAGSGKTNSITWAAFQLIECYPESINVSGAKDLEHPLFDSVIVVTDRTILDKQLRDNINEFSEVKNIVAPALSSKQLKENLEQGKKINITTIQKFPFIVEGIEDLSNRNFAVIIDEAHSSQSGSAAAKLNEAIGGSSDDDPDAVDLQDRILQAVRQRKMKSNASYFAFTATPKNTTLERFGIKQEDGSFKPFHLYSMKQAIEEGFILDVLSNYTTYKSYYEIEKSVLDNPMFDTVKAQKKLKAFVERDVRTIKTKAEVMVEHFITNVYNTKKLKGHAKGMVVTQSIESAIRYYQAINDILERKGNPFKTIIAFSGKKPIDGVEYTEADFNGFPDSKTKEYFDQPEYRLLIVANKYLTGFDQPKLCTMYVDKKLQGVLAVQALSRLNRSSNKYGKKTEDLFILDFFNSVEDIKDAFDGFYTSTTLSGATDVTVLYDLKEFLCEEGVFEWSEVEEFNELYFEGADAQKVSPLIQVAADRFNYDLNLSDEDKADFKIKAKQFVKVYSQVVSIIPFERLDWEQLYWFLKFLIPMLIVVNKDEEQIDEILESVDLSTYGLERTKVNQSIGLDDSDTELDPQNPNPRGAHGGTDDYDELDAIIKHFNERWFGGWEASPEDQRVKMLTLTKRIVEDPDFLRKVKQNQDRQNGDMAFEKIVDSVMRTERKNELDLYKLYAQDDAFKRAFIDTLRRMADR